MASANTLQPPLWRAVVLGAATVVALDIVVFGVLLGLGMLTVDPMREAFAVWTSFHSPAFAVADEVLPRPQREDEPLSPVFLLGLLTFLVIQAAVIGAILGFVLGFVRRRYAL